MSVAQVIGDIALMGEQMFDHVPIIRNEVEKFVERFERNERHREFDGILRASHSLVEAAETPVEGMFDLGKMEAMIKEVDEITRKLEALTNPQYQKEHDEYLEKVKQEQKKYVEVCRQQALMKMKNMASSHIL